MKKHLRWITLLVMCVSLGLFGTNFGNAKAVTNKEQNINDKTVTLTKINENVWVHTTYEYIDGAYFPSNGLVISTKKGLVLVDSSWDDEKTRRLLKKINDQFHEKIKLAIITHSHYDRIGGIRTLLQRGIDTRSTALTTVMAVQSGYFPPKPTLDIQPVIKIGGTTIETYYPGEAHTRDNIVVYLPQYKVLFGGCMIRSLEAQSIGNVEDANVDIWPASVKRVMHKFPDTKIVVPGHQAWGNRSLLTHTLELLKLYQDQ